MQFHRPFLQRRHQSARPLIRFIQIDVIEWNTDTQIADDLDVVVLGRLRCFGNGFGNRLGLQRRDVLALDGASPAASRPLNPRPPVCPLPPCQATLPQREVPGFHRATPTPDLQAPAHPMATRYRGPLQLPSMRVLRRPGPQKTRKNRCLPPEDFGSFAGRRHLLVQHERPCLEKSSEGKPSNSACLRAPPRQHFPARSTPPKMPRQFQRQLFTPQAHRIGWDAEHLHLPCPCRTSGDIVSPAPKTLQKPGGTSSARAAAWVSARQARH